jgi:hypothetical protein
MLMGEVEDSPAKTCERRAHARMMSTPSMVRAPSSTGGGAGWQCYAISRHARILYSYCMLPKPLMEFLIRFADRCAEQGVTRASLKWWA